MPPPLIGALRQVGIAKEPSWASATVATTADQFPPVSNPKFDEIYDPLPDDGFDSRISKTRGWQQGFRSAKYTFETQAYPDVLGNLLMAVYGIDNWAAARTAADGVLNSTTTVTSATLAFVGGDVGHAISGIGIPAGTYIVSVTNGTTVIISQAATATGSGVTITVGGTTTHPFVVNNAGLPPSYTIQDFYGIAGTHTRSMTGMYMDSLSISGADKGPMKVTVGYAGGKFSTLVAKPSGIYSVALPFLFWNAICTLNSVIKLNLLSWSIDLKRAVEAIPGAGSQDPSSANSTDFECTGKMMFEPSDDSEYLLYVTSQQAPFPLSMVFTNGATTLTHTMTKCQFDSPTTFDSGPYIKTSVSFFGIDNATDQGACATTVVGGKSGSAY